jgi:glucosyl-3-phosphoglycerate phosphatase
MTGRVFLVRHGRTALNAAGRLRSHLDPPLDEVGQSEAAAVAAGLWEWRIVKILSSPLLRALQTATAIAEAVAVPVTAVDDLIDRDYGPWSGELEAAVVARFGSLDAAPGVESQRAVAERSFALLEAQLQVLEHGDVVLVSHEAVNRALLTHLDPGLDSTLRQRTGCWNEIRRNHGRWTVSLADQRPEQAMDSQEDGR